MKLHPSQRSLLAERLIRKWIRARHLRLAAPKVYVVMRSATHRRAADEVTGMCYARKRLIVLHIGPEALRVDSLILLVHEFAHYLDYWTTPPAWRRRRRPHGDRFQILLWKTLKRPFWRRASSDHWVRGSSAHDPKYQMSSTPQ
jgi:predicted SprT family Zn-dependent metalloprotease